LSVGDTGGNGYESNSIEELLHVVENGVITVDEPAPGDSNRACPLLEELQLLRFVLGGHMQLEFWALSVDGVGRRSFDWVFVAVRNGSSRETLVPTPSFILIFIWPQ
jgi:hypothetical protein